MSEQVHRGRIRVSVAVWPYLGSPEMLEEWHHALLLPDAYEIVQVHRIYSPIGEESWDEFAVIVRHPALPAMDERVPLAALPTVNLTFSRKGDIVRLDRLTVEVWQGDRWITVYEEAGGHEVVIPIAGISTEPEMM